jgi:hypothetical protein
MSLLHSHTESVLCILLTVLLVVWNWQVATRIEIPYPPIVVDLYAIPLTRIALLALVTLSALWSPAVGMMAALAFVCLGADVIFFTRE